MFGILSVFDYFQELVLDEDGKKVTERTCYPGNNNHGMVAWKIDLKTPEYPKGREIVVIANDISHQIGLSYTVFPQIMSPPPPWIMSPLNSVPFFEKA